MEIITVVRDFEIFNRLIQGNIYCKKANFNIFDNRIENRPISVCYNDFLANYNYSKSSWLIFCHEDFEFQENLTPILKSLNKNVLHSVIGGKRCGFLGFGMQVIFGNMTETNRNGSGRCWSPGKKIFKPKEVEAFDCCCLIVHSSLVQKYNLRFDENLLFDLYVEDFCAQAKVKYKLKSFVHPIICNHHSGSRATERLYRHLPYLEKKYPNNYFVGTITYFGSPSWQKKIQDRIMSFAQKCKTIRHL